MKHSESQLQQECIRWFNLQYPQYYGLLFAVPNAAKRSMKLIKGRYVCVGGKRAKDEGMVSGVSDLIFLKPSDLFHGLCIEMKYGKGKQTDSQIDWETSVKQQGYLYVVCNSADMFMKIINTYLK